MKEGDLLKIDIRQQMFQEMIDKNFFNQAKEYAFKYIDNSLERNVFRTNEAIEGLDIFSENLPDMPNNASEIIKQLHKYDSPATVSQIGGRYFGTI